MRGVARGLQPPALGVLHDSAPGLPGAPSPLPSRPGAAPRDTAFAPCPLLVCLPQRHTFRATEIGFNQ